MSTAAVPAAARSIEDIAAALAACSQTLAASSQTLLRHLQATAAAAPAASFAYGSEARPTAAAAPATAASSEFDHAILNARNLLVVATPRYVAVVGAGDDQGVEWRFGQGPLNSSSAKRIIKIARPEHTYSPTEAAAVPLHRPGDEPRFAVYLASPTGWGRLWTMDAFGLLAPVNCPSPFGGHSENQPLRGLGQSGGCRRPSGSFWESSPCPFGASSFGTGASASFQHAWSPRDTNTTAPVTLRSDLPGHLLVLHAGAIYPFDLRDGRLEFCGATGLAVPGFEILDGYQWSPHHVVALATAPGAGNFVWSFCAKPNPRYGSPGEARYVWKAAATVLRTQLDALGVIDARLDGSGTITLLNDGRLQFFHPFALQEGFSAEASDASEKTDLRAAAGCRAVSILRGGLGVAFTAPGADYVLRHALGRPYAARMHLRDDDRAAGRPLLPAVMDDAADGSVVALRIAHLAGDARVVAESHPVTARLLFGTNDPTYPLNVGGTVMCTQGVVRDQQG
jgi:hypothetical protein